ncbi:MAG TPA: ligase-associated DNA damage response endonuclease PdeM [Flavisolibacter sp.]|nr:ligase-associated DNA damage response endonuclease PdeM [Flavisolibacter sp.]
MQAPVLHTIHEQKLWLSAQRSVFWEDRQALIVSDLHFGKTGHFRKAGIAVPQNVYKEDLQRLVNLLHYFRPKTLIVVGDFFHSHGNLELDWFKKWRADFAAVDILLVKGNHDILQESWYGSAGIELIQKELTLGPFLFTHEPCEYQPGVYTFCGHIHPGIVLHGLGKQSLRLPCFYFGRSHCILPAFSRFTGTALVEPSAGEKVFAIVENQLLEMNAKPGR